jgi:formylglycine-generating enzyme required for sulfatase activity
MDTSLDLDFVLIPAGEFIVGSGRGDRDAGDDERPQHRLAISDFYIMRNPVTNAHFQRFMAATGHRPPLFRAAGQMPAGQADHPVVGVSFHDAVTFCRWARTVTGLPIRLPTEAEWEKAARGPDGRRYPWGDKWDAARCNNRETHSTGTTPVGRFSPTGDSPYGVADLAGNVQDWCASFFGPYPYDPTDGREALVYELEPASLLPRFHESGAIANAERAEANLGKQTLRGGSWRCDRHEARCAYRSWAAPMHRSDDTGFRCCYEV